MVLNVDVVTITRKRHKWLATFTVLSLVMGTLQKHVALVAF